VRPTLLTIALLSVLVAGCAPSGDQATARAVTDRFFAAVASGDGDQACAQLSPDTRSELESQEKKPCREAITGLGLEGSAVQRVDVHLFNAMVALADGDAVFLDQGEQGWRLSAVGCKDAGKPADRPYDCELED
jgi:ketosteroid isomerase-like protein